AGEVGNTQFDYTDATGFRNNFDRVALYGSYPIGKYFLPMGGFQYGRDDIPVRPTTFTTGDELTKFDSKGAFIDGAFFLGGLATTGIRYDWFHPNTARLNEQWALTPYVNIPVGNGFHIMPDY